MDDNHRLLNADTRLTAEHIFAAYHAIMEDVHKGGCKHTDLTVIFDMALRETFAAKEVERLEELVGKMHIGRVHADAELETQGKILTEVLERKACNDAILKARTDEMHKAHHKLKRVKQVQDLYKKLHKEAADKLDLDEEDKGKWVGEDLDEIEMRSEVFKSAYGNIRLALANLTPMTMKELKKEIGEYVWIYWEDPDGEKSRMFFPKTMEVTGDSIKLHGYGKDELIECHLEELFKVRTCA